MKKASDIKKASDLLEFRPNLGNLIMRGYRLKRPIFEKYNFDEIVYRNAYRHGFYDGYEYAIRRLKNHGK